MKKVLSLLLSITMLLSITAGINITANAKVFSGYCGAEGDGSNLTWSLNENTKVLTISGTGEMKDYSFEDEAPWCTRRDYITSVVINSGVTSIGGSAFRGCYSLTSITVDSNNQNYSSQDGVLFNKDKTVLIQYPEGNTRTSYKIPNSVTHINSSAFYGCYRLTSITIPNSVTSIGEWAFNGCDSLSDVYYSGSEAEWKAISIGLDNECLTNATIHYNSTGGDGTVGGGGGGGFVPAPTPEEPTTQPSTKPSAPATTTTKKPSTVKVEKVTKGTKSFKVTWKKKTGVSGYQVQYATDKKFKKNKKTVTIAKKNATSKTIKKLKAKKTYYVRVRTYKIVNGKKVYSSWSKVKAVKTK